MAENRFKFKLLTGADPAAQYAAITLKDAYTFYLLKTGIGYLGDVSLFDSTNDAATIEIVTNMLTEGYVGDNKTVPSSKAVVDYVTDKISNLNIISTSFFRKVESHTLTEADITNTAITKPAGAVAGDIGLLFTSDTDGEDGNETYYFISLKDYLSNVYTVKATNSINLTMSASNEIQADLKLKDGEKSLKINDTNGGVYIEKTTTINDGDGTEENGPAPSADKLVTEESLVNYVLQAVLPAVDAAVTAALKDVVTYTEDNGGSST